MYLQSVIWKQIDHLNNLEDLYTTLLSNACTGNMK